MLNNAQRKLFRPNIKLLMNNRSLIGNTIYLERISRKHVSRKYVSWLNDKEICKETRHGIRKNTFKKTCAYVDAATKSQNTAVFAIITKDNNVHVGNISLYVIWEIDSGEISIMIGDKEFWGKGIATEAYKLIIDYGFKVLDLHKLKTGMTLRNKAMMKVAQKAGMKKECILKEDAVLGSGEYVDIVQYFMLNPGHKKGIKK